MFDRFGEFDSAEEINATAEGLKAEGDMESIYVLAEENGLDREDAEDYIDGAQPELTNALLAAYGKLKIEDKELNLKEIQADWLDYIRIECSENPEMAAAVRRKGASLEECIIEILRWSFAHQVAIKDKWVKAAGIKNASKVTDGTPGRARTKKIIREYYLGKQV